MSLATLAAGVVIIGFGAIVACAALRNPKTTTWVNIVPGMIVAGFIVLIGFSVIQGGDFLAFYQN